MLQLCRRADVSAPASVRARARRVRVGRVHTVHRTDEESDRLPYDHSADSQLIVAFVPC